ncbi:MAG: hypothetical protein ACYCXK_05580 [Candidatus Humimicrobiaceae bacterium]
MRAPDPTTFIIGIFEVRWCGILITIALILGIFITYFIAKYRNLNLKR